jgi:single-stranded-DNA-specific exonuclease
MTPDAVSAGVRPLCRRRVPENALTHELAELDPVLAGIYASRGIRNAQDLDYSLAALAPVGSLPAIDAAVELLLQHRLRRITIIGDFDADPAGARNVGDAVH